MMRPMPESKMPFRFRRGWLAASLLCLILVLTLTHIPHEALPKILQENMLDKVEHIAAYGLIAFLFLQALPNPAPLALSAVGLLVLAVIGILDEATQPLVNRHASVWDYVADLVGILLACVIFLVKKLLRFDTAAS
jgi:VanZ family protein